MPDGILLLIIVAAAAAVFGLPFAGLGFFPPLHAEVVASIRDGRLVMKRGHLRGQVREDAQEVLAGDEVRTGFIAITRGGKVFFSRTIPPALHQRLRNVLLN